MSCRSLLLSDYLFVNPDPPEAGKAGDWLEPRGLRRLSKSRGSVRSQPVGARNSMLSLYDQAKHLGCDQFDAPGSACTLG